MDPEKITSDLPNEYKKLVNKKLFSDVTFEMSDGALFYGHKIILSQRSSHFNGMFCSGLLESNLSSVQIPDVNSSVFLKLLEFIYSGSFF